MARPIRAYENGMETAWRPCRQSEDVCTPVSLCRTRQAKTSTRFPYIVSCPREVKFGLLSLRKKRNYEKRYGNNICKPYKI